MIKQKALQWTSQQKVDSSKKAQYPMSVLY